MINLTEVKEMASYEDTLGEIDLERARYLLSVEGLLEEMLVGELPAVERVSGDKMEAVVAG
ncbi:MAG: hypothetical protein FIB08_09525 [Candidatus Methanoperedens sp.]|nr:hypothetical protein [Candidatus Methanoperedens sp.]